MDTRDTMHIAIAPPDTIETSLIREVADIVNKDLYETRRLLTGKIPRIVAHCQGAEAANAVARSLRALGLVTIVCRDIELRQPSRSFRAYTLKLEDEDVIFQDRSNQAKTIIARNPSFVRLRRKPGNCPLKLNVL